MARTKPAPITSFDAFIHMAPIVSMRGTRRAVWYYEKLVEEVNLRKKKGVFAIENEKARVVWDNIAIWPIHRDLKYLFNQTGVALVADTYTGAWTTSHLDASEPLDGLASAYYDILLNHSISYRLNLLKRLIHEYEADGFILHSNRSCKRFSLGQIALLNVLSQETGKPGILIEADMADPRNVSFETLKTRLLSFFEQIL